MYAAHFTGSRYLWREPTFVFRTGSAAVVPDPSEPTEERRVDPVLPSAFLAEIEVEPECCSGQRCGSYAQCSCPHILHFGALIVSTMRKHT